MCRTVDELQPVRPRRARTGRPDATAAVASTRAVTAACSWPLSFHLGIALLAGAAVVVGQRDARAAESKAEIQINLCSTPAQAIGALKLAEKGKSTTVWLFDSPTLSLNQAGLRLRLREQGKGSELTLKVAGQNCATVDSAVLQSDGKCEADLHGDAFDDVVSLTRRLDAQSRATLLAADTRRGAPLVVALKATLDARQRTMLAGQRGMAGGAALLPEDIARLGPSTVRAYRSASQAYEVEVWTLPGGRQFVELSDKVSRDAAFARRAELVQEVTAAGIAICPDQDSQARAKLVLLAR
jgi:hypothetical protein